MRFISLTYTCLGSNRGEIGDGNEDTEGHDIDGPGEMRSRQAFHSKNLDNAGLAGNENDGKGYTDDEYFENTRDNGKI